MNSNRDPQAQPAAFKMNARLTPAQVYLAAIGLFEFLDQQSDSKHKFTCLHVIANPNVGGLTEIGRLYRRDNTDQYYLLHYPGKDSDDLKTNISTNSLREINSHVENDVREKCPDVEISKVIKLFVVCEVNTYFGVKVDHYIFARYSNNTLVTSDSISRDYNLDYVNKLFGGNHLHLKLGWQNMWLDSWQCGHYVLQLLLLELTGKYHPEDLKITQESVAHHSTLFSQGYEIFTALSSVASSNQLQAFECSSDESPDNEVTQGTISVDTFVQIDKGNTSDINNPTFTTICEAIDCFTQWCDSQQNEASIVVKTDEYIAQTCHLFPNKRKLKDDYEGIIRDYAKQRMLKIALDSPAEYGKERAQTLKTFIKNHPCSFSLDTNSDNVYTMFGRGNYQIAREKHAKAQESLRTRINKICDVEIKATHQEDKRRLSK
jgi:hypothetical protein